MIDAFGGRQVNKGIFRSHIPATDSTDSHLDRTMNDLEYLDFNNSHNHGLSTQVTASSAVNAAFPDRRERLATLTEPAVSMNRRFYERDQITQDVYRSVDFNVFLPSTTSTSENQVDEACASHHHAQGPKFALTLGEQWYSRRPDARAVTVGLVAGLANVFAQWRGPCIWVATK